MKPLQKALQGESGDSFGECVDNIKVSIVFAAKTDKEAQELINILDKQEHDYDIEYCYSTEGGIAEAVNKSLDMATGKYVLFTETDARPVDNFWIKNMVESAEKNKFIKALEVNHQTLNWCSTICHREDLKDERINENYTVAEDTEFFLRLKHKHGMEFKTTNNAVIKHNRPFENEKAISRAYIYGRNTAKLIKRYGFYPLNAYIRRQEIKAEESKLTLKGIKDELSEG